MHFKYLALFRSRTKIIINFKLHQTFMLKFFELLFMGQKKKCDFHSNNEKRGACATFSYAY